MKEPSKTQNPQIGDYISTEATIEQVHCLYELGFEFKTAQVSALEDGDVTFVVNGKSYLFPTLESVKFWFQQTKYIYINVCWYKRNTNWFVEYVVLEDDGHTAAYCSGFETYESALSDSISSAIRVVVEKEKNI